MSSTPLLAWQEKFATDIVPIHVVRAKDLFAREEYDLALNLAENALVVSCDAILRKDGFQVRTHIARFAYPMLPTVLRQNAGLLNRIRTTRNAAQYEAPGLVSAELAAQAIRLADQAVADVTRTFVA
jgi:uncharacterized protein (UPF0332 family)